MRFSSNALALCLLASTHYNSGVAFAPSPTFARARHRDGTVPLISCSTATNNEIDDTKNATAMGDYAPVQVDTIRLEKKKKQWKRPELFGTSLIPDTLEEMEDRTTAESIREQKRNLRPHMPPALVVHQTGEHDTTMMTFAEYVQQQQQHSTTSTTTTTSSSLQRTTAPTVLQLNIGLYCNQACQHCHVESSPLRTNEYMTAETAAHCLHLLDDNNDDDSHHHIQTLDLTGGAPELNPSFRLLVASARAKRPDLEIIDRCNLTVFQEPQQGTDLMDFLVTHRVRIVASLPCYSMENVEQQRGNGVFDRSIASLLALNERGYGIDEELPLDLVYNPVGAFLPPEQKQLEQQYKEQLREKFGIEFRQLFTMTNMPIRRFADFLYQRGELTDYMDLLVRNFNVETTDNLMCLETLSVNYDGAIFDCDFNQQLGMNILGEKKKKLTVFDLNSLDDLSNHAIRTDYHCFGCTAGMGSS